MSSPHRLLFVDDDANLLAAFRRNFRKQFVFDTAQGADDAMRLLQTSEPYAVVVADMNMPGKNGIELLETIAEISPDTVALMLTGNADQHTAVEAVNRARVFRFLNKPCSPEQLIAAIEAAVQHYDLRRTERELLEGTLTGSVKLLTDILGMVAPDALGRGQRLRLSIGRFARSAGLGTVWECEVAALLSSIGFAAVPPHVLEKLGSGAPLTLVEETIIRRVPEIGHDLIDAIPRLQGVADGVLYQRKNYDGTGTPVDDCLGKAIPLPARLLRIFADRLALEEDGVVKERALEVMLQREGLYDPALLASCFELFPAFLPNAISSDRPVLALPAMQLKEGQVPVSDITTLDRVVIVAAGHQLTASMVERIHNYAELAQVSEPVMVQTPPSDEVGLPKRAA